MWPWRIRSKRILTGFRVLVNALAAFCRLLPSARRTHLLALSNMLLRPVSKEAAEGKEQPYDRKLLTEVCAQLPSEDLAETTEISFLYGRSGADRAYQLKTNDSAGILAGMCGNS